MQFIKNNNNKMQFYGHWLKKKKKKKAHAKNQTNLKTKNRTFKIEGFK